MVAMTAPDGPHYGAKVKLDGPGSHRVSITLLLPPYRAFSGPPARIPAYRSGERPIRHGGVFARAGVGNKGGY